jgi:tripartite-type tricarboxylate transporter receptor subunit TctC
MTNARQVLKRLFGAALLCAVSTIAFAQAYPSKQVTIIVPWPPGGPSDIAARPMAKGLQDELGKPFIIDNRAARAATSALTSSPNPRPMATRC